MKKSRFMEKISWLTIAVLTTGNQICMKFLAANMQSIAYGLPWFVKAAQSPWVLGIIFCEVVSLVLWMRILATTEISRAVPLTAMAYILIVGVSYFIFHETVTPLQIFGITLILAGVWLVGRSEIQPSIKEAVYES